MSSVEFDLRAELEGVLLMARNHIDAAMKNNTTDYINPQDLTRDELIALKQSCLDSYLVLSTSLAIIKKMNANSKAQSSSAKVSTLAS